MDGTSLSYEEYLESQVTSDDLRYLKNAKMARSLVETGLRGKKLMSREEFAKKRKKKQSTNEKEEEREELRLLRLAAEEESCQFLKQLARRCLQIKQGKLSCVVYVRCQSAKGQQISGYVDVEQRMADRQFVERHFVKRAKFKPKASDLSFYNFETMQCDSHDSDNWQVTADPIGGLQLKNRKDRRTIAVDPFNKSAQRVQLSSNGYAQIVFLDHYLQQ